MAGHGFGSGVVSGEGEADIAELRHHLRQIPGRAIKVLAPVMGIDAKRAGRVRHQLTETNGSDPAAGGRVVGAFDLDIGPEDQPPLRDGDPGAPQAGVGGIAKRGIVNR